MSQEEAVELAQDPGSDRLNSTQVIEIHKLHIEGVPWNTIAERIGTTRNNVQRIVQGRRHRNLHPKVSPYLYEDVIDSEPVGDSPSDDMRISVDQLADAVAKRVYGMLMETGVAPQQAAPDMRPGWLGSTQRPQH